MSQALMGAQVWRRDLILEDFIRERGSVTADGNGDGTITIGPVPAGRVWYVERINVDATGATAGQWLVYRDRAIAGNLEDSAPTTALTWAFKEWPPLVLMQSERLLVVGDAFAPAAVLRANIRARQLVDHSRCETLT